MVREIRFIGAMVIGLGLIPAAAQAPPSRWEIKTHVDRLDPAKKTTAAYLQALEGFPQHGYIIDAVLVAHCFGLLPDKPQKMGVALGFSQAVAIGSRQIRWRVDTRPVRELTARFYGDGKTVFLAEGGDFRPVVAELSQGKRMRLEGDLPWAGNVLLEFDILGAPAAFAKVPCKAGDPFN